MHRKLYERALSASFEAFMREAHAYFERHASVVNGVRCVTGDVGNRVIAKYEETLLQAFDELYEQHEPAIVAACQGGDPELISTAYRTFTTAVVARLRAVRFDG
jgi:DNA-binding FadR family transcriptional regulator